MATLASVIKARGDIHQGDRDKKDVLLLQTLLKQAGYRVDDDGIFGPRTDMVVKQFQKQHGLKQDGIVGPKTANLLDNAPPEKLIETAVPLVKQTPFNVEVPHDDTASLVAFYGDPRKGLEAWKAKNVTTVPVPWTLFYEGEEWKHPVQIHKKVASNFKQAVNTIWVAAGKNDASPLLKHVRHFSGSGNFRPVRGSSRLSTHAFWASIDFDGDRLPIGKGVSKTEMPEEVVNAFKATGAFWGGDYTGRKDPMHFQYAHE